MEKLGKIDEKIIRFMKKCATPASRISLFAVFFWFGILKILGVSPAGPLVQELYAHTISFIPFATFYVFFGLYEMLIGIAFLVPGLERFAIALLVPHMITTILPLILLQSTTWSGFLVPTLEGQYIIKNLIIIALAIGIASKLTPFNHQDENK